MHMLELKGIIFDIKRSLLYELKSILNTVEKIINDCEDRLL